MSNPKFKKMFKQSKLVYGELHPYTLLLHICTNPLLSPYICVRYPFILIKFLGYWLFSFYQKLCADLKLQLFCRKYSGKPVSEFVRPLALYLPQYHHVPENDEWWGEGFTEWTNVRKAQPLFAGHYQPHVPHRDIGYYDLSDVEVMRKQAMMAKQYGIYGFCFYYYHFADGKRLLEKPINNWLRASDIDFPFCFCWANENWTRAWDGGDKEVIMPQDYHEDNMLRMLTDMIPAFEDCRYIKVEGKPLLFVYRAEIVPQIKALTDKWRSLLQGHGFDGLYLVSMQNFKQNNPYSMGFDAAAEFAPQKCQLAFRASSPLSLRDIISNDISFLTMSNVLQAMKTFVRKGYPLIKCICPAWDNSPRRGENGARIVLEASPKMFDKFMRQAVKDILVNECPVEGLLLINAWNEWGEGAHLEPDEKYGYQNLEVVRDVLKLKISDIDR